MANSSLSNRQNHNFDHIRKILNGAPSELKALDRSCIAELSLSLSVGIGPKNRLTRLFEQASSKSFVPQISPKPHGNVLSAFDMLKRTDLYKLATSSGKSCLCSVYGVVANMKRATLQNQSVKVVSTWHSHMYDRLQCFRP